MDGFPYGLGHPGAFACVGQKVFLYEFNQRAGSDGGFHVGRIVSGRLAGYLEVEVVAEVAFAGFAARLPEAYFRKG